jgi:hypothetical protein
MQGVRLTRPRRAAALVYTTYSALFAQQNGDTGQGF